jgi:hypothetical protein
MAIKNEKNKNCTKVHGPQGKKKHTILKKLLQFRVFFCFPQYCDVTSLANHPQEELAKFGYRTERTVFYWPCLPRQGYCV